LSKNHQKASKKEQGIQKGGANALLGTSCVFQNFCLLKASGLVGGLGARKKFCMPGKTAFPQIASS